MANPLNKDLVDQQQAILDSIIVDDEDQDQLGSNEPLLEDDNDDDIVGDQLSNGDDDNDEDTKELTPTEPVAKKPEQKKPEDNNEDTVELGYRSDRVGNLLDKDGKILFTAGRARSVFEKTKKALYLEQQKVTNIAQEFNKIAGTAQELMRRYKEVRGELEKNKKHGLTDLEVSEALDMRALMKVDPKGGVRKLLTMLHLGGTDLSDIGVKGPLDPETVARHMLDIQEARKPKPVTPEETAEKEALAFLQRHPAARAHTELVAEAKQRYPNMSFDEIWFQIQLHARNVPNNKTPQGQQGKDTRIPNGRIIPRNSHVTDRTPKSKTLSLKAVDPSQSFSQIGAALLADLKAFEE